MKESLFWRVLSDVRAEERGRFLFFLALSGLLGLALTAGLIAAEALFLSRVGIGFLPHVLLLSAVVTVAGSLIYAYWVGRRRNDTFFAVLLLVGATLFGLGALGTILHWPWAPAGLLVVYFLGQAVFLNHYWTFTWDYFDTLATKRLFPLLPGSEKGPLSHRSRLEQERRSVTPDGPAV